MAFPAPRYVASWPVIALSFSEDIVLRRGNLVSLSLPLPLSAVLYSITLGAIEWGAALVCVLCVFPLSVCFGPTWLGLAVKSVDVSPLPPPGGGVSSVLSLLPQRCRAVLLGC